MPKISIFYSEPPRKRNRMFQFLKEIPLELWVVFFVGAALILVLDYLQ